MFAAKATLVSIITVAQLIVPITNIDTCNQAVNDLYTENKRCIEMLDRAIVERGDYKRKFLILRDNPPEPVLVTKTTTVTETKIDYLWVGGAGLAGLAIGFILSLLK